RGEGGTARGGPPGDVVQAPAGDLDRPLPRSWRFQLFAQHTLSEVPADDNDLTGPRDAGAAHQRPAAAKVTALGGKHVNDAPGGLAALPAVYAETGRAAQPAEPTGQKLIEHVSGSAAGPGAAGAAAGPARRGPGGCGGPGVSAPCPAR